jgi:hypothetical protein
MFINKIWKFESYLKKIIIKLSICFAGGFVFV